MYDTEYRVQFLNGDDIVVDTQWIVKGENASDPTERENDRIKTPTKTSTAQFDFVFAKWDKEFSNILSPLTVKALFSEFLRKYQVYFYNDAVLVKEDTVSWGHCPESPEGSSSLKKKIGNETSKYYEFAYWSPSLSEPITGETIYRAQFVFDGYIEDDWNTIASNCSLGKENEYGYGGRKKIDLSFNYNSIDYVGEVEAEIIDKKHDILEYIDPNYSNGDNKAGITFKCALKLKQAQLDEQGNEVFVSFKRTMNNSGKDFNGDNTLNAGGWALTDIRKWLNEEFITSLPYDL
jgi:hypothetical protein